MDSFMLIYLKLIIIGQPWKDNIIMPLPISQTEAQRPYS